MEIMSLSLSLFLAHETILIIQKIHKVNHPVDSSCIFEFLSAFHVHLDNLKAHGTTFGPGLARRPKNIVRQTDKKSQIYFLLTLKKIRNIS